MAMVNSIVKAMDTVIEFSMPAEENPELGAPVRITHGCDYMLLPEGGLEFHYNFLVYEWTISGDTIQARAYLDEPSRVSVFVEGERLRTDAGLAAMVRYLQRRFSTIQSFGGDGYSVEFKERSGGQRGT
jgi:hypothetical protein